MYGLPKEFTGSDFFQCVVEQVCFSAFSAQIFFAERSIFITIFSSYRLDLDDSFKGEVVEIPVKESALMRLIGKQVASCEPQSDGTLRLIFSDSSVLEIFDDSDSYESYTIQIAGKTIVV